MTNAQLVAKAFSFSRALAMALHDKELEHQGASLTFYYDADAVVDTVVGLTGVSLDEHLPDLGDAKYVVRALLSTGYLPRINFLRPHLIEFHRVIKRLDRVSVGRMSSGFYTAAMRFLTTEWGLPHDEAELKAIATDESRFHEFVKARGFDIFVKLELVTGGTWKHRLLRLAETGQVSLTAQSLLSTDPDPGDEVAARVQQALGRFRNDQSFSANNHLDAHAIAELCRRSRAGEFVRFYTDTDALRRTMDGELFWQLDGVDDRLDRNAEYFLIRSSFTVLAFPERAARLGAPAEYGFVVGIEDLATLSKRLREVLAGDPSVGIDSRALDLGAVMLGQMTLPEFLEQFGNLKFLASVFCTWELPRAMEQWLPTLYRVRSETGLFQSAQEDLVTSLGNLWQSVSEEILRWERWLEALRPIGKALAERHRECGKNVPTALRDLGLARWGVERELRAAGVESVENTIRQLLERGSAVSLAMSELAWRVATRNPSGPEKLELLCVLWFLRLDALICTMVERSPASTGGRYEAAHVMYLVAKTKQVHAQQIATRTAAKDALEDIRKKAVAYSRDVSRTDPAAHPFAEMGYAHVCYWAWHEGGGRPSEWIKESFRAAARASEALDRGSLAWVLAINHCAFVGVRGRVYPRKTEQYVETVRSDLPREHRHFRTVLTVVAAASVATKREIDKYGGHLLQDSELSGVRRRLLGELRGSLRRLAGEHHCGDLEVIDQIALIRGWLDALAH
jgi:hypothetical protein